MKQARLKTTFWLGLVAAAIALSLPAVAQASTNVVPNPGFEQGGCGGNTPVICGWGFENSANTFMSQDTNNYHSGTASMVLGWGGAEGAGGGASARTDPSFCSPIGPGAHPASFWYGDAYSGDDGWVSDVSMTAAFFPDADCTGTPSSGGLLSDSPMGLTEWKQVSGVVVAPSGTQSALFSVGFDAYCSNGSGWTGCWTSANFDDIAVEDTVLTTPAISSFTPTHGTVGTSVDILGATFTGATAVTFNGTAASFTVDSDSELHAIVPSGATYGPISVTTPQGTGTSNANFFVDAPWISSYTPWTGPVGTSVDIHGIYFTGATSVKFNGTAAAYTVDSDSELHATVPSGATTGLISVTTPSGTGRSSDVFLVTPPPSISSFTPTSGPVGTSVDIQGTNFTDATSVTFNGTADPSFVVNSSTDVTAHVPAGATTGPISVTTPSATATSASSFTVTPPPPTVSSFAPTSGPVGSIVTISGSSFTGASGVSFNGTAASYTINSPTTITATVPSGATIGPIAVTTPYGTGTSAGTFTVTLPPTITSFTPSSGSVSTNVTISGSNFIGVTKVKLGKIVAAFTANSPTNITATVPSIAHGSYKWSVTTPAGTATSTGSFHVA
jgi:hypothetical protein